MSLASTDYPRANRFTALIGCAVPIQQAGMGSGSPPALVTAVSEAGGLGMLGMGRQGASAETLGSMLDWIEANTTKPYGVNFIIAHPGEFDLAAIELAAQRAKVVEFFWGWPDPDLIRLVHENGALCDWQVGSVAEAAAAAAAGCDFIIAQGVEAGGHVRGTTPLFDLLPQVLAAVDIPVLAAGGIGTALDVSRALGAGASGVRVGTRFIASEEASAHPEYVAALIAAKSDDTVYTDVFRRHWDAPHRVLKSCVEAALVFQGDTVGTRRSLDGSTVPLDHLAPAVVDSTTCGYIAAMPLWAGMGVGAVTRVQPAAEILRELASPRCE